MVGDYLWAAYKTGMIYVYDVSTNPWTVKKDWQAHKSPVCGLLLDPSSVWTLNRLQVTSLGTDNFIRLWDGMLEEDWLETRMQSRDVEYCSFREIRAAVLTWNAGASVPRDSQDSPFIQDVLHLESPPEILVFGFQELVDLENKRVNAKSLFMGNKKKAHDNEHMSRQYRVWKDHLDSCINQIMPLGESYVLLHTANLVGLFTCVFVKHKEREKVRNVSSVEVKRGMGGLHGNKGALILRFVIDDSSICFVNCHLAAGQTQTAHRNNDIAAILESESLPAEASLTARADLFVGGGDGTMILDHEICVLNGDLNYRIDSMTRSSIIDAVRNNNLQKLLERDQLLASKRKNPGFRLRSFNEALITFAPTYKYDVGTDEYDSSEKKRSPAWCDRILYRGVGRIKQMEYRRHEVRASDHRPVSALFKMRVKTISPRARADAWGACQKEFLKEKRRLAREASIEYLVNVLGTDPQEARRLITSTPQ
jgi:endonuclease/exonuclease/phosphatase family metal-dependent hydrolase